MIVLLLSVMGLQASAATFPVLNGNNAGAGSLRQAILDANAAGAGPHTISFTVSGTITITTSLPALTVPNVTIDGGNTVTISAPGGDNTVALFILNTGANNTTIKGFILQNAGVQPITINGALSGVTLENLWLRQTGVDYANHGIYVGAAASSMTIRNVTITDIQKGTLWGIRFRAAVNGLTIEGLRIYNSGPNHVGAGNDIRGIQFEGIASNISISNSTLDMDAPASADDGNYGIYFNTTVTGLTMDSVQINDPEIYHLFIGGVATNINLNRCVFDNFDGWTATQLVRFNSTANNVTIDSCVFNADQKNTADDGDNALWFNGNMQSITIQNSTITDADFDGIYAINGLNNDNITITGNTFLRNGSGGAHAAIHFTTVRNTTSDGGPVLINNNTFRDNNGAGIYLRPNNTTTYMIPNLTISNNIITGSKVYGGIKVNYIDRIIVTQNSIYNNLGSGIDLTDGSAANCGYEGANVPQLLSSAETSAGSGVYNIQVRMPAICGSNGCSLELFSNEAGVKGIGGQHYIQNFTGLGQGVRTLANVTGAVPGITAAPYGTWTATLRAAASCGTSEFSNSIPVRPNGPAGINLGIKLWLRGDDISVNGAEPTADGQLITGWQEFSGGGGPSASTVVNNPVVRLGGINFNPMADMDGDVIRGVFSGAPSWITTPTTTTVAVFNPQSISAVSDRFFVLFAQGGWDYNNNKGQIEFYRGGNNIHSYRGSTLLSPAIPGITGVSALGKIGLFSSVTTSTNHTSYYNAANIGSGNYSKGNFAISQWFIGGGYGPDANGNGAWQNSAETDFAEVFVYNRTLTAPELQKVQSYMALKYGIAMKQNYVLSNGTQVWDVSANATWSKEIAALARDNVSVLHQKQAKAVHADEVISIGLGSALAATNKDNAGEIPNDLSVLMWGNDSAATAFTQTFTAGTHSTTRMPRVWKVQKVNWSDQDITIRVKGAKDNNYLLISSDPSFNTITQELQLRNDGTITLSSALLTNGVYFTFGREQKKPGGVLNGLSVWVKADEGVALSGTNAITWEDQGPSQRIWPKVNTTALNWSSAAINYNPAILFPGPNSANYFNYSPQFTNTFTQGEVFSVQSSAVNNVAGFPWHLGGTSGSTTILYRYTDNNMYLHFGTNARRNFSFGSKNMALPVILNVNTASSSWTASLDGKVFGGPAAYTTSFAQQGTSNAIGVGYGSYFNGPVSEVILYNRKLNATERQQVNSYMALKYGITLDQTTSTDYLASDGVTTMWKASDNTGFANNIAGIGRDDSGSLYQKQSRSINTAASGNLISIGAGTDLAPSNADNADSIANDKSFLVWADNNGAITYTTNVTTGGHVTLRMPRVWKAEKTNWADRNFTIKFFGSVRNTYLLISNSDATFAAIDQEIALNADSTVTINSSLLPDGAFFTFGKELLGPAYVNNSIVTWQRADDRISGADAWYDFSGNGNDAAQAVVADQPVVVSGASSTAINFNPGYLFKTSAEWFDYTNDLTLTGTGNKTVIWAAKSLASTGEGQVILSHGATGTNLFIAMHGNTNRPGTGVGGGGSTCAPFSPSAVPFATPLIGTFNRSSASSATMYTNGGFPFISTCNSNFASQVVRMGARNSGVYNPFNGNIAEVIVYNRSLSSSELQRVHSYLAFKHGITLDQSTPTDYIATDSTTRMWTASKNAGYGFRIAGIGRDDLTKLYQKQSRNQETNALIAIAAGTTVAADNASNNAEIDDLSFFAWSDNNLATTFNLAVTGVSNATFRMERVWKADRTNWADQDIAIHADKNGARYLLVNATDPAFGAGTMEYAINTTTGSVTINTANLPDGAYFTLATKIVGPGCVNNGIQMWLRADYEGTASNWADFSGNQVNATQTAVANQPAVAAGSINFNPALSFDGTNDSLSAPLNINPGVANPITAFTVYNADVISANNRALWGNDNGSTDRFMKLDFAAGNNANAAYTGGNVAGRPFINSTIMNDGPANGSFVYINNARVLNFTQANSAGGLNTTTIGSWGNGGEFDGRIGEVIFYNRALDTTERLRINSYLALKYGITLNQTTPTDYVAADWDGTTGTKMWTAADNTGYNFRITGIGRDDCDELYQKQSRNQEGGMVTIAIGSVVAAGNEENTDSIRANNSYLVFADNNLDTSYSVPLTVTGITPTVRLPRVWKIDKTNWIDADITIKYNRNPAKVYLLISTDPSFSTNVQEQLLMPDDSTVAFSSELLPDGVYFTFAKEVYGPGYVNQGIQVWLRADDSLSAIENWQDYSGNENHAVQPLAASQPVAVTSAINYNPGFDFDGSADYMDIAAGLGISGANPFTVVGLGARQSVGTWDVFIAQPNANTNDFFFGYHTGNTIGMGATGVSSSLGATAYGTANIPQFIAATRSGNNFSFYTNGGTDGAATATYNFNADNTRIGNRLASADLAYDGYMGEVVVYNRALNSTELAKVNSYLALKYGITLNNGNTNYVATDWDGSAGTVYWTADAIYKNNIAGIGRDDKTGLLQKQSRNVNTTNSGNMVAIGLESIATTNKQNVGAFADDLSFLVWGDNGLTGTMATEYPTGLDPNGCSRITRLQREWKVQETGMAGFVQVQFYLAGLVPNSATISDFSLLIDDDGNFGNGGSTIVNPFEYDAATQTVTFDNVDFVNGQFFTLVTDITNEAPGGVLTSLYTWYRADKGVITTTGASEWKDQSASLKDVAQATAANQPAYNSSSSLVNFNPALTLDGTNDVLVNTAISHGSAEEIFAVVLPANATGVQTAIGLGTLANTTNTTELRYNAGRLQYVVNAQSIINATATNGMAQIANGHRSGGNAALLLNGAGVANGTLSAAATLTQLNIGSRRLSLANNQFFNGQIAELAVYSTELSLAEREKITSYLAIKYGITIPHNYIYPNGTVVWDQVSNTGYGNRITGIGRDDCNGLHQKQSGSMHAGALVTIGAGTGIEASNAANTNVLENNSALLFGDDNANITTWTSTNVPAGRERIAREWKIQLTGTVSTVVIQVPANSSSATVKLPAEKNRMYLLIDADGDFTTGTLQIPMTLNGDNWEAGYEFTGNTYFTFATGNDFLTLNAKLILQGAWNGTAMRTDLKTAGVLPATDPYGMNTTPSVNPNAATSAVVDWVLVELRDALNPATVVASRAGFVLANGDLVDTTYTQPMAIYGADAGDYYVVIRHRNHLGIMTMNAADFSTSVATIDFTSSATTTYGNYGQAELGSGVMGLWAGDVNGDHSIRHSAKPSDVSAVANAVMTHPGNTSSDPAYTGFSNVYSPFDVNLDGRVYYNASPSDRNIIVSNVLTHLANMFGIAAYIIKEQLP